jgi:hypothetical protein
LVNQPCLNRGTLILLAPDTKEPTINVGTKNVFFSFQYNPEKLLHTFNPAIQPASTKETDTQCPPTEFFNLTFELDSVDIEPSIKKSVAPDFGLHPALAMLELMMQPQAKVNQTQMPVLVFRWGQKRSLPVYLVSMSVEEKTFDQTLNPTRASVTIILRVLSASEVKDRQAAQKALAVHEYDRTTLVEVYKEETDQSPATTNLEHKLPPRKPQAVKAKQNKRITPNIQVYPWLKNR